MRLSRTRLSRRGSPFNNMIYICKNDDDDKLRKAIYIGDGGQVTTLNGRSPSEGPEGAPVP